MTMARGRQMAEWDRTSLLAAVTASPYRDSKVHKKPFQPWEFHPMRQPKVNKQKIKISVECLKAFCGDKRHGN